jgi:5-methylcytosine-specific restriction endonuclease McrA
VLAVTDVCGLCGHPGAETGDHIIPYSRWPKDNLGRPLPGLHDVTNVQPAHGTIGNVRVNRCHICKRVCNQSKGNRIVTGNPRSRDW